MSDAEPKPEQGSEEKIIKEILANAPPVTRKEFLRQLDQVYSTILKDDRFSDWENEPDEIDPNSPIYRIEYGSKVLFINHDQLPKEDFAEFRISIIKKLDKDGQPEKKKGDDTRLAYLAAKQLMQEKTNETGKRSEYTFWSENPTMIDWAQTQGKEIFGWEPRALKQDNEGKPIQLEASTIFNPESETTK